MPRRKKEDELALSEREKIPRGAANARERTRMRVLSKAFGRLKLTLPWVPPDTKLSKLDTLRLATSYISHLQRLLSEEDGSGDDSQASDIKSHVVCWPFGHLRNVQNGIGNQESRNGRTSGSEHGPVRSPKSEVTSLDELHTQSFLEDFSPHLHSQPSQPYFDQYSIHYDHQSHPTDSDHHRNSVPSFENLTNI